MIVWAHLISSVEKPNERLLKPGREYFRNYVPKVAVLGCDKRPGLGKQRGWKMET